VVLLKAEICYVRRCYGHRWNDTRISSYDNQVKHSSKMKGITSAICEAILLLMTGTLL
jgi:transcriptional regulator of met regulon